MTQLLALEKSNSGRIQHTLDTYARVLHKHPHLSLTGAIFNYFSYLVDALE